MQVPTMLPSPGVIPRGYSVATAPISNFHQLAPTGWMHPGGGQYIIQHPLTAVSHCYF